MPKVKGMNMQTYDPNSRRLFNLLLLLAFVLTAWGFYWLGSIGYRLPYVSEHTDATAMKVRLAEAEKENLALQKNVAQLQSSMDVDLEAAKQVKETLHDKELEIAKLNQEVVFYRSLLAPEKLNAGVAVKGFDLHSSSEVGAYHYDLLLIQARQGKKVAKGKVGINIDGMRKGVKLRLRYKDIAEAETKPLKYSFKYFQRLNGKFKLPEGFEPTQIMLELLSDNKKVEPIQISYSWNNLVSGS